MLRAEIAAYEEALEEVSHRAHRGQLEALDREIATAEQAVAALNDELKPREERWKAIEEEPVEELGPEEVAAKQEELERELDEIQAARDHLLDVAATPVEPTSSPEVREARQAQAAKLTQNVELLEEQSEEIKTAIFELQKGMLGASQRRAARKKEKKTLGALRGRSLVAQRELQGLVRQRAAGRGPRECAAGKP